MSHIYPRAPGPLPNAVQAEGVWVTDSNGKRYIDGSGGAIVLNIGHGDRDVVRAMAEQAEKVAYVHGSAFTTESLEKYGEQLAPYLPMDDPIIFPVSGGSEAVETALKMARTYHLANGEDGRWKIIARWNSYHGNSRGALDTSGRIPLRAPYLPWLDKAVHVSPAYEYRCSMAEHPVACGKALAEELGYVIEAEGPETVAAFVAEPVGGATLGAAVPTADYWPAIVDVCRKHGVLVIADEVMTGFGRTGTWFAVDHWGVRPDIMTVAKGCAAGYWPLGLAVASGRVGNALREKGFVHGFTFSHHAVGAAVGSAVLRKLVEGALVEASRVQGERLIGGLRESLDEDPHVGDIRGLGLMVAMELVKDRATKEPFPRAEKVTERTVAAAKERGLLLYSSTGIADGTNGDLVMLGPPFVISNNVVDQVVSITTEAIASVF